MLYVCDFADNICCPMIGYEIVIGSPACTGFVMCTSNSNCLAACLVPEAIAVQLIRLKNYPLPNI